MATAIELMPEYGRTLAQMKADASGGEGCPECGCMEVRPVNGGPKTECRNCRAPRKIVIAPPANRCPSCGGNRFNVYHTRGKTQYRKCEDCENLEDNKTIKNSD